MLGTIRHTAQDARTAAPEGSEVVPVEIIPRTVRPVPTRGQRFCQVLGWSLGWIAGTLAVWIPGLWLLKQLVRG